MRIAFLLMLFASGLLAQTPPAQSAPASAPPVGGMSPREPIPGFIARVYMGSREYPTHVVAVIQSGREFNLGYRDRAADELRGLTSQDINIFCIAEGFLLLDRDTDVSFRIEGCDVLINHKQFGAGTYTQKLPKGKYPVEISRHRGKSQGEFKVVDKETGRPVVFYTGEELSRELSRSIRVGRRVLKSILLAPVDTAAAIPPRAPPGPAPAKVAGPSPAAADPSDPARTPVGWWRWSIPHGTVEFRADGSAAFGKTQGRWTWTDSANAAFRVTWNNGVFVDLTLSADGQKLTGMNSRGEGKSAQRLPGPSEAAAEKAPSEPVVPNAFGETH